MMRRLHRIGTAVLSSCGSIASYRSAVVGVLTLVAVASYSSSDAEASFTRPFLRQITGPAVDPGGTAVDSASHLWVGDVADKELDEFEPALSGNASISPGSPFVVGETPSDVAIQSATTGDGDIYVADATVDSHVEVFEASGKRVESLRSFEHPHVGFDSNASTDVLDPSRCSLSECTSYISEEEGIDKLNSKGVEVPFSGTAQYIKGARITGSPPQAKCGETFGPAGIYTPGAIAVGSEGDIYVAVPECSSVLEYLPSGEYRRAFALQSPEVTRVGPEGNVGFPHGVSVDSVSGHLLVAVDTRVAGVGAIDEFDIATGKFVAQLAGTESGQPLAAPFELTVDSGGNLYAVDDQKHVVDVWGPGAYYPTVTAGQVTRRTDVSATLNGAVNPSQAGNPEPTPTLEECYFQYVDEPAYLQASAKHEEEGFAHSTRVACEAPGAGEISSEPEEVHKVHANAAGLQSGVTYRYRLVAASGGGKGGVAATSSLAFTVPHKPAVIATSAARVTSTFGELRAQIAPMGGATDYYFEYGTTATYGHDAPALTGTAPTGASMGAGGPTGGAVEPAAQQITGLVAGTTYHFRVVAENEIGTAFGPDETFTTLPEVLLGSPDQRAYELVTPVTKQGGSDMFSENEANEVNFESEYRHGPSHDVGIPSDAGEGFLLETDSAFGEFPFAFGESYVFRREYGHARWTTTSLASPSLGVQTDENGELFDPLDLSRVAVNDGIGQQVGTGTRVTSLLGPPGGPYINLHEDPAAHDTQELVRATRFAGGSTDLSHVILESNSDSVCPGAEGGAVAITHGAVLCEWAGGYESTESGENKPELKPVNVGDDGAPISACGARLGAGTGGAEGKIEVSEGGEQHNAVSADGSRVFFTAPDTALSGTPEELAKIEGKFGCWNPQQEKVNHAPPINAPQLYARLNGTMTLQISAPEAGVRENGHAPVQYPVTYVGASEDGSRVFFVTETWMTANHPAGHDLELYECEVDVTEEAAGCDLTRLSAGMDSSVGAGVQMVLAISDDGSVVYFTANAALAPGAASGDCNAVGATGTCALYRYQTPSGTDASAIKLVATAAANVFGNEASEGDPLCPEPLLTRAYTTPDGRYLLFNDTGGIYRYDADTESLVNIAPRGDFTRSASTHPASGPVRAMSDDGSYVFFTSRAQLVPQATNGVRDVYEWHEALTTHHATLSLVGSGSDPAPSYFLGYSPYYMPSGRKVEGGNVFIGTHARLSPLDTNSVGDIYDARLCEAESPCIAPPVAETAQCEGGACQIPPVLPTDATPGSLTFAGAGNLATQPQQLPTPPSAAAVRAKKLAEALKACRKDKKRKGRSVCEAQARKRFSPVKKAKNTHKQATKSGKRGARS